MKLLNAILAAGMLSSCSSVFGDTNIQVSLFSLSIAVDRSTTFQNGEEFDLGTLPVAAGQLKLSIAAAAGTSYDLEQSMTLPAQSWVKTRSITLTNSMQIIELGSAVDATMFYRLRVTR